MNVELEKEVVAAWNQSATCMDFLIEKQYAKNYTSFISVSQFVQPVTAINKAYYWCRDKKKKKTVENVFDCDLHRSKTFGLVSGFYSRYILH